MALCDNSALRVSVLDCDWCELVLPGTGTNCCYLEDLDKVELWSGDNDEPRKVRTHLVIAGPY